jgi:DNA-directed RNA polymerase subunit RPC12/RpoP
MYCRKCKQELDLNKPNLTCDNCGYDNLHNPENLPVVTEKEAKASPNYKPKYQCPKCGSTNIHLITNATIKNTPFSGTNAAMGLCCLGLPGLLCGMTGGKKIEAREEKVCEDCGTHFI